MQVFLRMECNICDWPMHRFDELKEIQTQPPRWLVFFHSFDAAREGWKGVVEEVQIEPLQNVCYKIVDARHQSFDEEELRSLIDTEPEIHGYKIRNESGNELLHLDRTKVNLHLIDDCKKKNLSQQLITDMFLRMSLDSS